MLLNRLKWNHTEVPPQFCSAIQYLQYMSKILKENPDITMISELLEFVSYSKDQHAAKVTIDYGWTSGKL